MNEVFDSSRLEVLDNAENFIDWLYSKYKFHVHGEILEISSGIGTYSKKIISDNPNANITLTEYSENDVKKLTKEFETDKIKCKKIDMNIKEDYETLGYNKFDTIICSNVLEHVEKDQFALEQCFSLLKNKGKLILIVPQNPNLFSEQDKELGHFRRYTKNELIVKSQNAGYKLLNIKKFNAIGVFGWKLNKKSKQTKNNPKLIKIFNIMIPLIKIIDDSISAKFSGLSLIAILEKN
jgi:cyclopropane fatty-acyl-phospholipid synthase-like methyltransferase